MLKNSYLEHRPGKPGNIEKWFSSFGEIERKVAESESLERMNIIQRTFDANPQVLSNCLLEFWVSRIKSRLPKFGEGIFLDCYYDFDGVPLTLDYYLRVKGELEDDALLVGIAHDIDVLIGIAYKLAFGLPFSNEQALLLLQAGVRSEEYFNYKKSNRKEFFEAKKWSQIKDSQSKELEVVEIAKSVSGNNPELNLSGLLELIADEYAVSSGTHKLSTKTIRKYIRNTELISKHRDSRGKKS
ncbi:TPA: hypothetical protein GRI76_20970 [Vibrio parahaemolyticus]|uniref:hypothetical protein n=1 Tax=Vibrio alginolyticus TaxID=663 RepID=UPI001A1BE278|nr:hypothetical protein [Vibrio alginolyticus]MDL0442609.1 hypothetical protein [Vibrio alginolyticus]HAS6760361.1 hypothetical protein [Vibrio parahaemolyticus]